MRLLSATILLSMAAVVLLGSHLTPTALAQTAGSALNNWPNQNDVETVGKYSEREDGLRTVTVKYNGNQGLLKCTPQLSRHNGEVKALETLGRRFEPLGDVFVPRVLHTFSTGDGYYCMVLEATDGITLRKYILSLKNEKSEALLARLAMPIVDGVKHMHQEGITHGNINPDNIFVKSRDGSLDFKVTFTGFEPIDRNTPPKRGMYGYIPPEEYAALRVHPYERDAWMLGATLYFATNGMPPYGYTYSKNHPVLLPVPTKDLQNAMNEAAVHGRNSYSPIQTKNQALLDVIKEFLAGKTEDRLKVLEYSDLRKIRIMLGGAPTKRPFLENMRDKLKTKMPPKDTPN
ncbi:kinase-like domain-containing protein [Thamnocephalis sphaerospora]|uniref:Kinase-like domain-containing protein n=1 Tax=Thamnocephalis sphaerospora TaxID=78915 RepID=A0A4P9XVG2_9FUNG|nr:kinase-like domain-containing protein [Thamnocephalis sphaerospora]|eukprot:RKP10246.1 kinase-like domain-containing protein [Thamnocephalis sphaerospora]